MENNREKELLSLLARRGKFPVAPDELAELIKRIESGKLPRSRAREVLNVMYFAGRTIDQASEDLGIKQMDEASLLALCQERVGANPKIVTDIQEGKVQAVGVLINQAKKKNPNVDPIRAREIFMGLVKNDFRK